MRVIIKYSQAFWTFWEDKIMSLERYLYTVKSILIGQQATNESDFELYTANLIWTDKWFETSLCVMHWHQNLNNLKSRVYI